MKKKISSFALITLALIIALNIAFSCAAVRYYTYAVNEDFSSRGAFLAPGDVNGDKNFSSSDISLLRNILLGKGDSDYSDVTGEGLTDIKDLVRAKTNILATFVSGGNMNLNGNSVYSGNFATKLNTGVTYKITCRYKANSAVNVKISGLDSEKSFSLASAGSFTTVTENFTTPFAINNPENVKLRIVGAATVDSFKIEQINSDNEYNVGS